MAHPHWYSQGHEQQRRLLLNVPGLLFPPICVPRLPPIEVGFYLKNAEALNMDCVTGSSWGWCPPRRWRWGWISRVWTRSSLLGGREHGRHFGNVLGVRGGLVLMGWRC